MSVIYSDYNVGAGLSKALEMTPEQVIETIKESGLRGRGGAGFPTGMKWEFARRAEGDERFIICNADEGEPGTFKDRELLRDMTPVLLEGMAIAAWAVGARRGFIYLRGEYRYLLPVVNGAIEEARRAGRLGSLKDGFEFDVEVTLGAGAYVCGEEMALIESLEGVRSGEYRNRPPYPVEKGFINMPTVVNNVETLIKAAKIMAHGSGWFRQYGTEKSTGTKLISVSGDVAQPGVYEIPFGMTIHELLKMVGGLGAKAVQVGGASGICIPSEEFSTRTIAFEDVPTGGSVIVFGPGRDMMEVLENFMEFFCDESCGYCTPCREGNVVLLETVRKIRSGQATRNDVDLALGLCSTMRLASKCGLGQSVPNPFESIMGHFGDEALARAGERR